MGCGSLSKVADADIETETKNKNPFNRESITVLFLGVPNSGKSTIAKQVRVLYNGGFTEWERKRVKCVILAHINDSTSIVLEQLRASNQMNDEKYKNIVADFYNEAPPPDVCSPNENYPNFFLQAKSLWEYDLVKSCFQEIRPSNLQVNSGGYFMDHLERFYHSGFRPTDQDIVNTRIVTCGIQETEFRYKETNMKMIDVAGQRSERRKWIHCFDRVDFLIFCASLIDFEIESETPEEENALVESLSVFESVVNSPWFKDKPILVYLTKADLLQNLIIHKGKVQINAGKHGRYVVDSVSNTIDSVKHLYKKQDKVKGRKLYFHVLRATDLLEVKRVFEESIDSILLSSSNSAKQQFKVICNAKGEQNVM